MDDIPPLIQKLRRLLRSRGRGVDDTNDLIQEAFLRLQVYCQERTVEKPEAFLVRTALNLSIDKARHDRRSPVDYGSGLEKATLIDLTPSPDVAYAGQKRLLHWKEGVAALSPRRREVFLLNRVDGYSFRQIADMLGISLSMVEKHAAQALLFLTDWMEQLDEQNE